MSKKIKIKLYTNIRNNSEFDWNSGYTLPNPPYRGKFEEINIPTNEKLTFKDNNNFEKLMKVLIAPNVTVGGSSSLTKDVDEGLKKIKAASEEGKLSKDLKKKRDKQIKENIYTVLEIIFPKNGKFFIKDKILLVKSIYWNEKIDNNKINVKLHLIHQANKDKDSKLSKKINCDDKRSNIRISYNKLLKETKNNFSTVLQGRRPSSKPYFFQETLKISLDDKITPTLYKGGKKTKRRNKRRNKRRTKRRTNKTKRVKK